ncbi:MAG: energy transducer TonB [Cytophagales bacterium]|nr:energy transducer TonB [Cytophagales bacterium]
MKKFHLIILLFFAIQAHAQEKIGYGFDINRMPLEGYYDPLSYQPENEVAIDRNIKENFENGVIYDQQGKKKSGKLRYNSKFHFFTNSTRVRYKENDNGTIKHLSPKELKAFTIGVDSFFVVKRFTVERKITSTLRINPEFVQYLATVKGNVFARHFFEKNDGLQLETYMVKPKGWEHWVSFSKNKAKFREMAHRYFDHLPYVKEKLDNNKLKPQDINHLIQTAKFFEKYEQKKPILYTRYWLTTQKTKDAVYHGKIIDLKDSIWQVEFYDGDLKIIKGSFSSLYDFKKEGELAFYRKDGTIRKSYTYAKNEFKEGAIYAQDETLRERYMIEETSNRFNSKIKQLKYHFPKNEKPDQTSSFVNQFSDPESGKTIFRSFENSKLIQAYYIDKGTKVYFPVDESFWFPYKKIYRNINKFIKSNPHLKASCFNGIVQDNGLCTALVRMKIGPKKYLQEVEIINSSSIHPNFKIFLESAFKEFGTQESKKPLKFNPYKVDGKKVAYEIVVPIHFTFGRFYHQNQNYYWHMMNNQYMMPTPTIQFPTSF